MFLVLHKKNIAWLFNSAKNKIIQNYSNTKKITNTKRKILKSIEKNN